MRTSSNGKPSGTKIEPGTLVFDTNIDACISCGACVANCPIADWNEDRLDPRRMVRLVQYGLLHVLSQQDWLFQCTNCGRCSLNCPANIDLDEIISKTRGMVEKHKDPGPGQIQKTADLHREISNNMGLNVDDWLGTVEWMREELADEIGEFQVPIEKTGAEYFATINSKLPMYYPMDLQHIFKIFTAAKVSWTLSKKWWEGTNYAMFTNDEMTWERTLREQVATAERLGCTKIAYTECGHGYYATLAGYEKFSIESNVQVIHVVSLYARWIREERFKLDPSLNPDTITIHDPCNATRKATMAGFASIAEDLRYVLGKVCENVVEPTPNKDSNYCCGGGGGALLAGFKKARIYYGRPKVEQIDRTGAELVCTPCVNCFDAIGSLAEDYGRSWRPVHLWKLLANAIVVD